MSARNTKGGSVKRWFKKIGWGFLVAVVALVCFYRLWMYPRYTVPMLMYHYIDPEIWSLSVTPENFERQMKFLSEKKYRVISLDAFVEQTKAGKPFAHNTVVITFDDGRSDNYKNAYPVLKKYNMPATIFLITQWMDRDPQLTWDQVREMAANGIDFGSHTQHHRYVPDLLPRELLTEIVNSKYDIEGRLGRPANHFCFPSGGFTEEAKAVIRQAGYTSASTTNRGMDRHNRDLYELKRIKVKNRDGENTFYFWIKLSGYYNLFRGGKPGD